MRWSHVVNHTSYLAIALWQVWLAGGQTTSMLCKARAVALAWVQSALHTSSNTAYNVGWTIAMHKPCITTFLGHEHAPYDKISSTDMVCHHLHTLSSSGAWANLASWLQSHASIPCWLTSMLCITLLDKEAHPSAFILMEHHVLLPDIACTALCFAPCTS